MIAESVTVIVAVFMLTGEMIAAAPGLQMVHHQGIG